MHRIQNKDLANNIGMIPSGLQLHLYVKRWCISCRTFWSSDHTAACAVFKIGLRQFGNPGWPDGRILVMVSLCLLSKWFFCSTLNSFTLTWTSAKLVEHTIRLWMCWRCSLSCCVYVYRNMIPLYYAMSVQYISLAKQPLVQYACICIIYRERACSMRAYDRLTPSFCRQNSVVRDVSRRRAKVMANMHNMHTLRSVLPKLMTSQGLRKHVARLCRNCILSLFGWMTHALTIHH